MFVIALTVGLQSVVFVPSAVASASDTLPVLYAAGEAEVSVMPDQATVFFDIEGNGVEIGDAAASLDSLVQTVRQAVQSVLGGGVAMMPWGYTASPNPQVPRMYTPGRAVETNLDNVAVAGFQVEVEDLELMGSLLSALASAGVRQVVGILYTHSDLRRIELELTELAVQDAIQRAEALALGLRGQLGPVLRLGPSRSFDRSAQELTQWLSGFGGQQLNLRPRDIKIRVRVEGEWRLER